MGAFHSSHVFLTEMMGGSKIYGHMTIKVYSCRDKGGGSTYPPAHLTPLPTHCVHTFAYGYTDLTQIWTRQKCAVTVTWQTNVSKWVSLDFLGSFVWLLYLKNGSLVKSCNVALCVLCVCVCVCYYIFETNLFPEVTKILLKSPQTFL